MKNFVQKKNKKRPMDAFYFAGLAGVLHNPMHGLYPQPQGSGGGHGQLCIICLSIRVVLLL
ncbi:hypothetical protein [Marininema halotolerans]|uniref:Uncharacterized protein n=1 Tax=Marininema halotolerans TaxID=1155944 RepID=A0A1I6NUF1_9BACL|nr:hypothetical protein [Marininema halotolerans]SFS31489.1 hypothetical protein SAMN05444972_101137 [Marininema halotolerans]